MKEPLDNSKDRERAARASLQPLINSLREIEYGLYADESRGRVDSSLIEQKKKIIQELTSRGRYSVGAIEKRCARYREECAEFHKKRDEELLGRAPKTASVRRRRKKQQLTDRERDIVNVLKKGKVTGPVYCKALELKKIPPRQEWIDQGCPITYPAAYKIPRWTTRIQDEKYRLSQFLPKKVTRSRAADE
jgi:hypothetical protein